MVPVWRGLIAGMPTMFPEDKLRLLAEVCKYYENRMPPTHPSIYSSLEITFRYIGG